MYMLIFHTPKLRINRFLQASNLAHGEQQVTCKLPFPCHLSVLNVALRFTAIYTLTESQCVCQRLSAVQTSCLTEADTCLNRLSANNELII